ncbi:hypothetical protein Tco_1360228 [Tanacetum coccineum]
MEDDEDDDEMDESGGGGSRSPFLRLQKLVEMDDKVEMELAPLLVNVKVLVFVGCDIVILGEDENGMRLLDWWWVK